MGAHHRVHGVERNPDLPAADLRSIRLLRRPGWLSLDGVWKRRVISGVLQVASPLIVYAPERDRRPHAASSPDVTHPSMIIAVLLSNILTQYS